MEVHCLNKVFTQALHLGQIEAIIALDVSQLIKKITVIVLSDNDSVKSGESNKSAQLYASRGFFLPGLSRPMKQNS